MDLDHHLSVGKKVVGRPNVALDKGKVVWTKLLVGWPSFAKEYNSVDQPIVAVE